MDVDFFDITHALVGIEIKMSPVRGCVTLNLVTNARATSLVLAINVHRILAELEPDVRRMTDC